MAIRPELLAQVRQVRLACRLLAEDIEERHRIGHQHSGSDSSDPELIEVEMFRTGADYLRDAEFEGSTTDLIRYLTWMLRDFRKVLSIRVRQASLARDEPHWVLRRGANKTALDVEVITYRGIIIQIEQILRISTEQQRQKETA